MYSIAQNQIIPMRGRWARAIYTDQVTETQVLLGDEPYQDAVVYKPILPILSRFRLVLGIYKASSLCSSPSTNSSLLLTGPMAIELPPPEVAMSCIFDSDDADIILLSKNPPTEFHVHKVVLAAGSPFFRDMFTLPQPPSTNTDNSKPIIPVTESRDVITTLLQFVYPLPNPQFCSLDELASILDAAIKYDFVSAISTLRRFLSSSENLQNSPVQVYAIASRFDLEEEAQSASSHTLSINLLDGPLCEDLKYISAWQYHRLLDLHRTRSKSAQEIIDPINCPPEIKCMQCNSSVYTSHGQPKWYYEWEKQAKAELAVRPVSNVIFSMEFIGKATKVSECAKCSESVFQCWTWLDEMKQKMDALPTTI